MRSAFCIQHISLKSIRNFPADQYWVQNVGLVLSYGEEACPGVGVCLFQLRSFWFIYDLTGVLPLPCVLTDRNRLPDWHISWMPWVWNFRKYAVCVSARFPFFGVSILRNRTTASLLRLAPDDDNMCAFFLGWVYPQLFHNRSLYTSHVPLPPGGWCSTLHHGKPVTFSNFILPTNQAYLQLAEA